MFVSSGVSSPRFPNKKLSRIEHQTEIDFRIFHQVLLDYLIGKYISPKICDQLMINYWMLGNYKGYSKNCKRLD